MDNSNNGRGFECVVVDLNTQRDFCDADGAAPVKNLEHAIPAMRRVIAWIRRNQVPVVSSIESIRPLELSDSGNPICCVDGSKGQSKIDFTFMPTRAVIEVDNSLAVPADVFLECQQVIFRKRSPDLLANPKADRLLTTVSAAEFILFGNGVEGSVKVLALGLLARHRAVTVVVDACGYWNKANAELSLRQIAAKGARLVSVDELLARRLHRPKRRRWGNGSIGHNGNGFGGRSAAQME